MRLVRFVPLLALALTVGACGSGTPAAPRTVTEIVTASDSPTTQSGGTGITVVHPGGTGTATSTGGPTTSGGPGDGPSPSGTASGASETGTTSGGPASSTALGETGATTTGSGVATGTATVGPGAGVDPLTVSCPALLDSQDINKTLGSKISSDYFRIVDVAIPDVKMTGRIKCYFGTASASAKDRPVAVALAKYATAGDAQAQMDVTVQSEEGLGATASTVDVSGRKAQVLLRDGGLLVLREGTWTLSLAVQDKLAPEAKLPAGLQQLATMVLTRVIKNG